MSDPNTDEWWKDDQVVVTVPTAPHAQDQWWNADKPTVPAGTQMLPAITVDPEPGPKVPDKYALAAKAEADKNAADAATMGKQAPVRWTDLSGYIFGRGHPTDTGYTSRAAHGAGMGWADEILAGATTPAEMIKHGVGWGEGYKYAKARENLNREQTEKDTAGPLGMAAGLTGGLSTGAGVLGSGTRVAGVVPNYVNNLNKSFLFGAGAGAGEGDTLKERTQGAALGGVLGLGVGVVAQPSIAVGQHAARILQMPRLRDPEKVGVEHLADVFRASGKTPQQVTQEVADARAAGQPYTVADALGHEGQRKVAGLAKTPGEHRENIVETLSKRNLNMPSRVVTQVGEGLGVNTTADAASKALVKSAEKTSAPAYAESKTVPTWSEKIQTFIDDPIAKSGLRQGVEIQRLRTVGTDKPFNPKDAAITSFNEAGDPVITGVPNMETLHTLKVGLDRMIENEINPNTHKLNAKGQALLTYKNNLLAEIDAINPKYAEARTLYRGPMEVKDAVQEGRDMATRGRYSDNIAAFYGKTPAEQQGVRIGYHDKVVEPLEKTGNYPGSLRQKSEKGVNELDALSLYQGPNRPGDPSQLRRRLNREETMIETKNKALGGSSTAENLADMSKNPGGLDIGVALSAGKDVATHNWLGLFNTLKAHGGNIAKGESAAQRNAIVAKLLETDPDKVAAMARRIEEQELIRRGLNPTSPWSRVRAPRYPAGQ